MKFNVPLSLAALLINAGFVSAAQTTTSSPCGVDARMLRYPNVSATQIAFVYAGDIWVAPKSGGAALRLSSPKGEETFPRFSPDGRRLVTASGDGGVRLWDVATAREVCTLATLPVRGVGLGSVAFSPDGRRLAGCAHGQVWLWEAASPAEAAAREATAGER